MHVCYDMFRSDICTGPALSLSPSVQLVHPFSSACSSQKEPQERMMNAKATDSGEGDLLSRTSTFFVYNTSSM